MFAMQNVSNVKRQPFREALLKKFEIENDFCGKCSLKNIIRVENFDSGVVSSDPIFSKSLEC